MCIYIYTYVYTWNSSLDLACKHCVSGELNCVNLNYSPSLQGSGIWICVSHLGGLSIYWMKGWRSYNFGTKNVSICLIWNKNAIIQSTSLAEKKKDGRIVTNQLCASRFAPFSTGGIAPNPRRRKLLRWWWGRILGVNFEPLGSHRGSPGTGGICWARSKMRGKKRPNLWPFATNDCCVESNGPSDVPWTFVLISKDAADAGTWPVFKMFWWLFQHKP